MDNNSDEKLLIMQDTIEGNRQDSDEKTKELTEDLTETITTMMDQIKKLKYSLEQKYSPKVRDPTTMVLANKRDPPLEGGNSTKMVSCGLSKMRPAHQNYMNSSSRHK